MAINEVSKKNNRIPPKPLITEDPEEVYDDMDFDKMKVECICPKCGKNLRLVGRISRYSRGPPGWI